MIEDINRLIKIHLNLLYEGHGNYTKYSDIIKRTCPEGKTDEKYFLYNTLVAFNSSSLLNVSWGEGGMRWSINKNYKENSNFLFGEELSQERSIKAKIISGSTPLVYERNESFKKGTYSDYIGFGELVDRVVRRDNPSLLMGEAVETFDFSQKTWSEEEFDYKEASLIRLKDMFAGYRYYIYLSNVNYLFRVIYPEWTYFTAYYLLNKKIENLIQHQGNSLKIHSAIRVPAIILRNLYSHSQQLKIGGVLEFEGVTDVGIAETLNYLNEGKHE